MYFSYGIGKALKQKGVLGYFAVDFLVLTRDSQRFCYAIEINVRQGGTTHPYQTAKFLTGATYISSTGQLIDSNGKAVFYRSNDNLMLPKDVNLSCCEFIDFMKNSGVHFCKDKREGAVFHLLSALEEFGKIGFTVVGKDPRQVKLLSEKVVALTEEFVQMKIKKPA